MMIFKKNPVFWWGVVTYCVLAIFIIIALVQEYMQGAWRAEDIPEGGEITYPPLLEAKGEMLKMTIESLLTDCAMLLVMALIFVVVVFTAIKILLYLWGILKTHYFE